MSSKDGGMQYGLVERIKSNTLKMGWPHKKNGREWDDLKSTHEEVSMVDVVGALCMGTTFIEMGGQSARVCDRKGWQESGRITAYKEGMQL